MAVLAQINVNLLTLMLGYILDLIINDFQELDFSNLLEIDYCSLSGILVEYAIVIKIPI